MGSGFSKDKGYDEKPTNSQNNNNINANNQNNNNVNIINPNIENNQINESKEKQKIKNLMKGLFGIRLLGCNRSFRETNIGNVLEKRQKEIVEFAIQYGFSYPRERFIVTDTIKDYMTAIYNTSLEPEVLNKLFQETYQELPKFLAQVIKQNYESISAFYEFSVDSQKTILDELFKAFQHDITRIFPNNTDQSKYLGYDPEDKKANQLFVNKIKRECKKDFKIDFFTLQDCKETALLLLLSRKANKGSLFKTKPPEPKTIIFAIAAMANDLIDSVEEINSLSSNK